MVEEITYKEQSTFEVLRGNPIHFNDFGKYNMTIYDSGILHFVMKDGEIVNGSDLDISKEWLRSLGDKKYLNLIEAGTKTDFEDDLRKTSADPNENQFTIADAIVIRGMSQRIIANLYLRFNKPAKPTRIFTDQESAAFWLMSFHK